MYEIGELTELSSNQNGSTYEFSAIPSEGYLLAYRKAGSISGNHYHKGNSAAKNPERLLLVSGEISLSLKHLETGDSAVIKLIGPKLIAIKPKVLHTLKAESDVVFLEFNSLQEHKEDTYYPV